VDAHAFDPGQRSLAELAAEKFDRVFIALHGRFGEDGSLQGALELLGIPTGSGVMASSVGMDKITTKIVWLHQGLPTPRYAVLNAQSDLGAVAADLGLPLIVKPPHEGSTIGITKVTEPRIQGGLRHRRRAGRLGAGRRIHHRPRVHGRHPGRRRRGARLPIVEIVAPEGNYDYQNKYFTDDTKYFCPAVLPDALAAEMQRIAVEAYRALGCEGWGRVDVLLRERDQKPFLLEVNTSPGMTSHSLVPMAARAEGISYEDLCVEILRSARLKMKG
jgi:D-alanine-D-alanine ligase